jgi:hypothetical protein
MGGVTGFGGVRSSGCGVYLTVVRLWRVCCGHKKADTRSASLSGGSVCYGWAANSTTINAYKIGSAISAPAMALSISSLVMAYAPHVFGFGYHSTWNHADKAFY